MSSPSPSVSFRHVAMQSALILLLAATGAGIAGMHVTSRAVVFEQFESTTRRQADLAASYLDLVYEEAWRSLEFIEQDSYFVSLARTLRQETAPFTRSQIAAEAAGYLSLRYLRQAVLSGLFIVSDRFVIGSYTTDQRVDGSVLVLSPRQTEFLATDALEDLLGYVQENSPARQATWAGAAQRALVVSLPDGVRVIAIVSLDSPTVDPSIAITNLAGEHVAGLSGGGSGSHHLVSQRSRWADLTLTVAADTGPLLATLRWHTLLAAGVGAGAALVWLVVGRAFLHRIIKPLDEFNALLRSGRPDDGGEFAALVARFRGRSRVGTALRWFYLSLAIPVCLSVGASFVLFRAYVHRQIERDVVSQTAAEARNLSFRVQSLEQFTVMLALDGEFQAALGAVGENEPTLAPERFTEIIFRKGVLLRGVSRIALYDSDFGPIYPGSDFPSVIGDYELDAMRRRPARTFVWIAGGRERDPTLLVRVRGLPNPLHRLAFFANLGFVEIRVRDLFEPFSGGARRAVPGTLALVDTEQVVVRRLAGEAPAADAALLTFVRSASSEAAALPTGIPETPYRASIHPIAGSGWSLVGLVTDDDLRAGSRTMLLLGALVATTLLAAVYALSDAAATRVLRPVEQLGDWMESVELDGGGPPPVAVESEFVRLIDGFATMLGRLRSTADQLRREEVARVEIERRKKETELIALQTQMNPHFLSNIMSSVSFLIDLRRPAEASRMLEATGHLFRLGMYRGRLVVPVSEEVEHARAYVAVQEIRHRDEITVSWAVDPGALTTEVPKFILQPIIENSIEHGMRERRRIAVSVTITGGQSAVQITVIDDGCGIEPGALSLLQQALERGEQSRHLGLANVAERIALHHGVRTPVRVTSEAGRWCRVDVLIPRRSEHGTVGFSTEERGVVTLR